MRLTTARLKRTIGPHTAEGEPQMTIIVGVICKDGLVLASDSQAGSLRGVHVKRLDYTKIYNFSFDGMTIAITGAGETPFITRAIEIFEEKAKETKFHKPRDVGDLAESVVNEITKRYIFQRDKELGFAKSPSVAERPKLQDDRSLGFALMVATCVNGTPAIYTVYADGISAKEEGYASLGSGSAFAEYLLPRLHNKDLTLEQATRVCVYVVEEVKKVDVHCGGPTQVVSINCKGGVSRKNEDEMKKVLKDLEAADKVAVGMWRMFSEGPEAFKEWIKEVAEETAKEVVKEIKR